MPRRERSSRRERTGRGGIPVDSFSDIAFLLLIYFFLATTLIRMQGFTAQMPAGEKSQTQQKDKTPIVNIREGQMFLNDKPVDLDGLRAGLGELKLDKEEGEDKIVLLESSGKVPYQTYHAVMAAISKAGGIIGLIEEVSGS